VLFVLVSVMTPSTMMNIWMEEYQIHYWKDSASTQVLMMWRWLVKQTKCQLKRLCVKLK